VGWAGRVRCRGLRRLDLATTVVSGDMGSAPPDWGSAELLS
jgi:hypothetical protein